MHVPESRYCQLSDYDLLSKRRLSAPYLTRALRAPQKQPSAYALVLKLRSTGPSITQIIPAQVRDVRPTEDRAVPTLHFTLLSDQGTPLFGMQADLVDGFLKDNDIRDDDGEATAWRRIQTGYFLHPEAIELATKDSAPPPLRPINLVGVVMGGYAPVV